MNSCHEIGRRVLPVRSLARRHHINRYPRPPSWTEPSYPTHYRDLEKQTTITYMLQKSSLLLESLNHHIKYLRIFVVFIQCQNPLTHIKQCPDSGGRREMLPLLVLDYRAYLYTQ